MEHPSKELVEKAKLLLESGKVTKDLDTQKRIYFTVEGETETHSVIFEKGKKEWKCDCKFNSLHHRRCSHICACMLENVR